MFFCLFKKKGYGCDYMLPNKYQTGNTIRLTCNFEKEENGEKVKYNPDVVTITFMNYKYEVLQVFTLTETNIKRVGEYFFDYTLPEEPTRIIYKWEGLLDNKVFQKRNTMDVTFI